MPITASDIAVYASAAIPDDNDSGPNGGPIDLLRRVNFTQMWGAPDVVQVVSSAPGDTGSITVEGRTQAGDLVTDTKPLNGTTPVDMTGLGMVERILKAELANAAAGMVTVRAKAGTIIGLIPPSELGFVAPIRKPDSDPDADHDYYAKVFVCNRHSSLTLLSTVVMQAEGSDERVTHAPAANLDDAATTVNRLTEPAPSDLRAVFDHEDKPIGDLPAGSAIGIWLCLYVPANDNPYLARYLLRVSGQST